MDRQTLLAIVASVMFLLACTARAESSPKDDFPTGSYQDGDFVATFTRDGRFWIAGDDFIKAEGTYAADGDSIIFIEKDSSGECAGLGKYKWKFDGTALTFAKIADDCAGRVHHLTSRPWPVIKQGK